MNTLNKTDVIHHSLFLATGGLVTTFILSGYPFAPLFDDVLYFRAFFRIGLAGIILLRLSRFGAAPVLLFGYEQYLSSSRWLPTRILYVRAALAFLVLIGLGTELAALLLLVSQIYVTHHARYFSIEDISLQCLVLHLPFLGTGTVLSIDSILGISGQLESASVFNSLFVILGVIMFSAGYEKMKSQPWRRGTAVRHFLRLPHLARPRVRRNLPSKHLLKISAFVVLIAEFLLLTSALQKYALISTLFILLGFAVSLYTLVDLSYIGQLWTITLGLFLGSIILNLNIYPPISDISGIHASFGTIFPFVLASTALVVVMYPTQANRVGLNILQRYTTGVTTPIGVFNERHLYGIFTYKLEYISEEDSRSAIQVLPAFNSEGALGPLQIFRPRYFQGAMYPVTDFCLDQLKQGEIKDDPPNQIIDLCYAGLRDAGQSTGTVVLSVKPLDADRAEEYLKQDWQPLGKCEFAEDNYNWQPLALPPSPKRITR